MLGIGLGSKLIFWQAKIQKLTKAILINGNSLNLKLSQKQLKELMKN